MRDLDVVDGDEGAGEPKRRPHGRRQLTRFDPGNAHAWGLSIYVAYVGSGELDGGR
jgi:hypothetical protein